MARISEVKCAKCDRYYSAFKARCPYCGARRGTAGKHAHDTENFRGKMIIGIVVLALIVIAVGIILATANKAEPDPNVPPSPTPTITNDIVTATPSLTPPEPSPTETPSTPEPTITKVQVLYRGSALPGQSSNEPEFTLSRSEKLPLTLKVEPEGILTTLGLTPVWTSSNPDVFDIVPDIGNPLAATAQWTGKGNATLTVTIGDYPPVTVTVRANP
ncbi:MAG: hypothetical protein LBN02_08680 [Oscillospiraceae bacterium]|jgi:hypothetical protein|nr:hypothetical protein [Oscillospiraceae bacterium]